MEWNTRDSSVFAASGSDDQLTLWDLAVERDDDDADSQGKLKDLPPQLLFIHMVCLQLCCSRFGELCCFKLCTKIENAQKCIN